MADGKGCTCAAYSASECGCDADWTPQEIYDLRDTITKLRAERDKLREDYQAFVNSELTSAQQLRVERDALRARVAELEAEISARSDLMQGYLDCWRNDKARAERAEAELAAAQRERDQFHDAMLRQGADLAAARAIPREPTAQMVQSALSTVVAENGGLEWSIAAAWRAMYDAALAGKDAT